MSQMNPKEVFHNTAYSVQLPYIALSAKMKNGDSIKTGAGNIIWSKIKNGDGIKIGAENMIGARIKAGARIQTRAELKVRLEQRLKPE